MSLISLEKLNFLITKLIRLTDEEKITWEFKEPPPVIAHGVDDYIPIFCQTQYKDRIFAVYEERYQSYFSSDEPSWSQRIVLVMLDDHNRALWQTGESQSALNDLFNTIREKQVDIDSLIDDFLDDEADTGN